MIQKISNENKWSLVEHVYGFNNIHDWFDETAINTSERYKQGRVINILNMFIGEWQNICDWKLRKQL